MQAKTNVVEHKKNELESKEKLKRDKPETNNEETKTFINHHIYACEKIDKIFGSGGESIVHCMCFEQGLKLFDQMLQNSPEKTKEELLKELVETRLKTRWGSTTITIIRDNPPAVKVEVKDSPVKTVKGSQKHLIGSFWAGVFTRYFNKQLTCKDFSYHVEKDEFSCLITSSQS